MPYLQEQRRRAAPPACASLTLPIALNYGINKAIVESGIRTIKGDDKCIMRVIKAEIEYSSTTPKKELIIIAPLAKLK